MFTFILSLSISISSCFALTGLEIMKRVDQSNDGFSSEESTMTMTLIDANQNKRVRSLIGKTKEEKTGNKSLIIFDRPADVKGTKLFTQIVKGNNNKQWLYLPKFKRVKKIKSSAQSNSFMGSEFTFEDIAGTDIEKYTYKLLKEEKIAENDCWVIEQTPIKKSGYSKVISWISKKYLTALKADYYDRKKELLKTSLIKDISPFKVQKKTFYRAKEISMDNIQTRKKSFISWKDRKLGQSLDEAEFHPDNLKE